MATCRICNIWMGEPPRGATLCPGCRAQIAQLPRAPAFTCFACGSHAGVVIGSNMGRCRLCGGTGTLSVSARSARRRELDRDTDVAAADVWESPPQMPKAKKKPAPKKPKEETPKKSVWDWVKKPAL